ncbi:MAG: hypothetical protein IJR84_04720 [Bacteroidaceae bacterium]|nr:hypothetical protein [Bacteroidaceae bacterium]
MPRTRIGKCQQKRAEREFSPLLLCITSIAQMALVWTMTDVSGNRRGCCEIFPEDTPQKRADSYH